MSAKALHAMLTLIAGLYVGIVWLRAFWNAPRSLPPAVLAAPVAAALLGLGHWVAYDFSIGHWAGDFSLLQAIFNLTVTAVLFTRRNTPHPAFGHPLPAPRGEGT